MKIYLDYVFFINFLFDFILLLGISIVLKRTISKTRLLLGSLIGGLSGFIILFEISSLSFFILKLLLGLLIVIITFCYKNIKYTINNFMYLIILSILLGGSLYLLNIEASKTIIGSYLSNNNIIYVILLIITSFIIITIYSKYINKSKKDTNNKYKTVFTINNKKYNLIGYLDTGNSLTYKNRPVLILNKNINIDLNNKKIIYIPFVTLNSNGVMKGILLKDVIINNKKYKNIYLGLSNDKFHLKDADIILNTNIKEEKYEINTKTNTKTKAIKRK